ncbi:ATP-dependent DNA ligase [Metapseudomonas otitidis]|uniref:ATP-dependent DNA ligase n=1 Tax=Metapseudomonas otitidis TaxID=319939 RepID=UPI0013F5CD8C|nr:ATP-dependent DNA ligase [Pseudomonas otitidis]
MAVQEVILKTDPCQPVPYSEKAVQKVFAETGYVIADTKKDGVQLNLVVNNTAINGADRVALANFLSRAGKFLPAIQMAYQSVEDVNFTPVLRDDCCIYPDGFMIQAEIVTPGQPAEVTSGNLRRTKVTNKDPKPLLKLEDIEIHVFGVVPLDTIEYGEDHDVTHAVMKYHVEAMTALLQKHVPQIKWVVNESIDVFTYEELQRVYGVRREADEEGLVVCDPNAIWKRGKKAGKWKMKPEDTIDGTVQGLIWGTPGLGNEGKVIGFEVLLEDGHVVNACGLTQAQKEEFTEAVLLASRNAYGYENFPTMTNWGLSEDLQADVVNCFQGWAVEVSFMERFKDGSLRHPSFSRWRGISDPLTKE